jgi:integrative and conjugative element protein (TIGR02256 family)
MIHWYKKHPKHLAIESSALSNDSNYNELFQVRDNLFISHGNIVVRLNKIHLFPILVVYPEATPYALPLIYPLKETLKKEQVEDFAKCNQHDIITKIRPFIEYYYYLRHQNKTGVLCLIEWDNLDDGFKFHGITTVLKRVRDWYGGMITQFFPPDSQEVEFSAHFNNVDFELKFFYPEIFLNIDFIEGEAYGILINHLPKGKFYSHDRWTYFGCLMVGKNKNGLYENIDFVLPNFFFEEGITNALDLINKKDTLTRLINVGNLLKTYWFQILKEPNPFKSLKELIIIIGESDYKVGLKRIMLFYLEALKLKPDHFFIAIRFPNRKGIQEFQLFKILKKQDYTGGLIGASDEEAFNYLIESYDLAYAIQCEKFSDESFHQRNLGRANRSILNKVVVNVIGVGALGSEIADILGKSGIGTLCLFDNQEMKGQNPVRHLAGLDHVGISKVLSVADIIRNHNPFIELKVYGVDINSTDLNDSFIDGSVSISSIAEDNTEGFLNEKAVITNKVVYYVRALRGGKIARIFRVIPGKDACFNCLDLYRKEGNKFINIPEDKELPTLKNECNNPIRPASAADLKLISSLVSRILLDELQRGYSTNNQWIWSTESLPPLKSFQIYKQVFTPHPKCYYCNHERKVEVYWSSRVEQQMKDLIAENPNIETGGVLAGELTETGVLIITDASSPGPKAKQTSTYFQKDVEYCQKFLDDLFVKSNKKIIYLGEWHSHPSANNHPSGTDIKSLTEIAFQKEYLTEIPIMIIFSNTGKPSCTLHPAGKSYYFTNLLCNYQ